MSYFHTVKPICRIEKERFEGQDYVVCSAIANPKETDFTWSLKNQNDTLEHDAKMRNGKSYMLHDTSITNFRTYVCVANNTIGHSVACERDVPGTTHFSLIRAYTKIAAIPFKMFCPG